MSKYRPDIDGLRAIAVTLVVLFHAKFESFSGGYVGVDIFFVISGFLITSHLLNELESTGSIDLTNFYAKRFKRLYPALVTTIVLVSVTYYLFFSYFGQGLTLLLKSATYSIVGFGNLFFLKKTGGYFDNSIDEMPFLHFWSLGVEEQFYFFWPLFILVLHRLFSRKFSATRFTIAIILLCLSSFSISEYWLQDEKMKAFYLMPARIWELAIGGLVAVNHKKLTDFSNRISGTLVNVLGFIAIVVIGLTAFYYKSTTTFPGLHAVPTILATLLLIILGSKNDSLITKILSFRFLVFIGLLSYSWYLWHWPILSILNIMHMGQDLSVLVKTSAVVGSLLIAYFSLNYIEKPVRTGQFLGHFTAKKTIFATGIISIFIIAISHITINLNNKFFIKKYGSDFLKTLQLNSLAEMGCYKKNKICGHYEENSNHTIYLWGDSHAASYIPLVKDFSEKHNINSQPLVEVSQLPLVNLTGFFKQNGDFYDYKAGSDEALKQIKEDKKVKSVILSARWNAYTGNSPISVTDKPFYLTDDKNKIKTMEKYKELLNLTIHELFKNNVQKILILLQFPEFKFSIQKCLHREFGCPVSREENIAYRKDLTQFFLELQKTYPNKVQIFDPLNFYCNEIECPQVVKVDNKYYPTTYDDDHPSTWSILNMYQNIQPHLLWLTTQEHMTSH